MKIDIYIDSIPKWLEPYAPKKKDGRYGPYMCCETKGQPLKNLIRSLKVRKIRFRIYDKDQERSADYRKIFLSLNPPPYTCRYCSKPLEIHDMCVDHIVPVNLAKRGKRAVRILKRMGASSVNDPVNLTASCYKCNKRKGDHIGLWLILGLYGDRQAVRWAVKAVYVLLAALILAILYILVIPGLTSLLTNTVTCFR